MEDEDRENKCGERFVYEIRNKCKYLFHALTILLEKKEDEPLLSWQSICDLAAKKVKKFEGAGIHATNNKKTTHQWVGSRTIMKWFRSFRDNGEKFFNTPLHTSQIDKYPSIFHINPSLKEKFILYAKANINGLKAEVLYNYFHHTIIPELIEEEKEVTGENMTKEQILRQYGLSKLTMATIYNWMSLFGFKYSLSKENYYVDSREKPETVEYCKKYTEQYIKDELHCFRWLQLTNAEVEQIESEKQDFDRNIAYQYIDPTTQLTMYEFHVDDLNNEYEKLKNAQFGGYLSVRKKDDERPIIMIGQDKCIFKQFLLVKK